MKYGTVLRVARLALIIGIIAILVVPLVVSLVNTDVEKMSAGIESKYDLESINSDENIGKNIIKVNLKQIDSLGDRFYVAIDDGDLKEFFGDTVDRRIDEAADYIFTALKDGSKQAVIYDAEKNVCLQKSIQYHDGITTKVLTGMKMPDKVGGMATVDISMRLVGKDVDFDIPFGSSTTEDGFIIITTEIPDLLMMLSNAIDHDLSFKVFLTINGAASFNVNVDILTTAIEPTVTSPQEIVFSNAAIGSALVTVGTDVQYNYNQSGNVSLHVISGSKSISESIVTEDDGRLKLTYQTTPGQTMTGYIEKEYVDDIINTIRHLEAKTYA